VPVKAEEKHTNAVDVKQKLASDYTSTVYVNVIIYASSIQLPFLKKGFWFRITAEEKVKPEAHSSIPMIQILTPTKIRGQKTF
jgi:hypothetical protein